jgi:hypothetical protein
MVEAWRPNCFRAFRLSIICCVGQTYKLPGFNDPARKCRRRRANIFYSAPGRVAPPPTRLFFAARWQSGNEREFSNRTQREDRMIDENWDHLHVRRNNIRRYRRLLQTELTELERRYIERRLSEEKSAMESLTSSTAPN